MHTALAYLVADQASAWACFERLFCGRDRVVAEWHEDLVFDDSHLPTACIGPMNNRGRVSIIATGNRHCASYGLPCRMGMRVFSLLIVTMTTGCSVALVRPRADAFNKCTTTLLPPVADTAIAMGGAAAGLVAASDNALPALLPSESSSGSRTRSSSGDGSMALSVGALLVGAGFIASAIYGYTETAKCRRANAKAHLSRAPREPENYMLDDPYHEW